MGAAMFILALGLALVAIGACTRDWVEYEDNPFFVLGGVLTFLGVAAVFPAVV